CALAPVRVAVFVTSGYDGAVQLRGDMDPDRRKQLESRLQTVLSELSSLCGELGIELGAAGAADTPTPIGGADGQRSEGPILIARNDTLHIGFIARNVQEIVRMVALSAPVEPRPEVLGFVNLRGEAIPVLDLRRLLGQEPTRP